MDSADGHCACLPTGLALFDASMRIPS